MKNLNKKNLRVLLLVAICITLVTCLGSTYAFFVYRGNGSNVSVEAGDINVKFTNDNNYLTTANSYPISDQTGKVLPYYSDFSINATTTDIGIKYEIQVVPDANNSIDPQYIRLYLTDQDDNRIAGVKTYSNLKEAEYNENANLVYTGYITETSTKDFRLRMWIDESYNLQDGQTFGFKIYLYAVNEKANYMARLGTIDMQNFKIAFWPENIEAEKANITSVNFVTMNETEMSTRYNAASISADVTDTTKSDAGSVLAWLETDTTDTTKYTMYVASDGTTYFPDDCSGMFGMFPILNSVQFNNINTTYTTNMSLMFMYCTNLLNLDVTNFDTSGVVSMDQMFMYCSGLTSIDVSVWDTSNVIYMVNMFCYCSGLTSLDLSGFNTSSVNNMMQMFLGCSGLKSLDVSGWDTSSVTNMDQMFRYCSSLTSLDVSGFVTSGIQNMVQMFGGCSSLISLDLSNWDTSSVTSMNYMFDGCSGLKSLDVSGWDTSGVTSMAFMFMDCSSLTSLDVSGWDTSGATDMDQMFYNCSSLKSLDVSGWDTSGVTEMYYMFKGCSNLTTIYANTDWNTGDVSSSNMFLDCIKLVGAISYDSTKVDIAYANPTTGYFTKKTA